jgi:uncharacterized membrane protein YdbT with pleckstrin-like domain
MSSTYIFLTAYRIEDDMAYYTKILLQGEEVRAVGRLHWAIYLRAWFAFFIAAAAGIAGLAARSSASQTDGAPLPAGLGILSAAFLILGVLLLIGAWTRRVTTEIVVTDRRIIFKEGFVRRRTMEMNMNKVETVDVVQSIAGRIFNYGAILIRGVGSSYEPLRLIADPLTLRTAIIAL